MSFRRPANRFALPFISYCLIFAIGVELIADSHLAEAFTASHRRSYPPCSRSRQIGTAPSFRQFRPSHQPGAITSIHLSNEDDDEYDPRDNFGRSIRGFQTSALKTTVDVGDTVVCKRSIPNLGIYENSSYEVSSIYTQYFDDETQQIVKQPLSSLSDDSVGTQQNKVYMTLFSPQHHSEPVIVTPEEVGLASVREELGNAVWLAVPGLFWVFLAASFLNTYHERTGGSISDAFLGR